VASPEEASVSKEEAPARKHKEADEESLEELSDSRSDSPSRSGRSDSEDADFGNESFVEAGLELGPSQSQWNALQLSLEIKEQQREEEEEKAEKEKAQGLVQGVQVVLRHDVQAQCVTVSGPRRVVELSGEGGPRAVVAVTWSGKEGDLVAISGSPEGEGYLETTSQETQHVFGMWEVDPRALGFVPAEGDEGVLCSPDGESIAVWQWPTAVFVTEELSDELGHVEDGRRVRVVDRKPADMGQMAMLGGRELGMTFRLLVEDVEEESEDDGNDHNPYSYMFD